MKHIPTIIGTAVLCLAAGLTLSCGKDRTNGQPDQGAQSTSFAADRNSSGRAPLRRGKEPTESEKMAMGRVFYVYAKQEILMSQLASQGRNEGEAAAAQFLAALGGGGIMTEVDTEGCPQDFADAWKEFVAGAAGLKIVESGYNFMVAAVRHAQQTGQYVDWDTRKKLAEMEQKLPGARKECMEKMEAFAVVCRKYGLENLQQWSLEAYRRHEGDPNAKLFKSDRNRSD